ncbi:asparaginase [Nocardiopsis sp. CNT312]|uniref:asparaginase n=1 Tax=Nocardiopsis sp. CNT312 TaxID=1137268 RepID=UPI000491D3B2|nr:asparaginase [Nocardiopsis sp. CNT312]
MPQVPTLPPPEYVPLAEVTRSGMRESVHYGAVVALSATGGIAHARGPVHQPMFPRSAAKPFQALAMLRAGAPLEGADLALAAGSHSGEDVHADRARSILERAGLTPDALHCPEDAPLGRAAREAFLRAGRAPHRLLMNCSGKHAGMLAACRARGWDTDTYTSPGHPLQVLVRETTEEMAGEPVAHTAVDGCGAPQFALSLAGLARGLWRMRSSPEGTPQRRVVDAMSAHPGDVAGTDRTDTELMTLMPGMVAKIGAEGVQVLVAPTGEAAAVKISDGDAEGRARALVALDALRTVGADVSPVRDRLRARVHGGGAPVGAVRPL